MNAMSLDDFALALAARWPTIQRKALASCRSAIRLISISGVQKGLSDGTDVSGNRFAPLKHPRPSGGTPSPLRDKGLLAASVSASVTQDQVTLSANSPGARIQNYGGTVRAKKKFLTIPISKEAARAGGAKKFPRKLFFRATKSATKGVLCESVGGQLVVHYVLVPEVTIPARNYLGWSAQTLKRIEDVMAEAYAAELARIFRK